MASLIVFPVLGGAIFPVICLLTGAIERSELAIVRARLPVVGNGRTNRRDRTDRTDPDRP